MDEAGVGLLLIEFEGCVLVGVVFETVVRELDAGPVLPDPSPSLTNASTALSRFPFKPFKMVVLRLSSGNPMSRNISSLESRDPFSLPILAPNTLDGLLGTGDVL